MVLLHDITSEEMMLHYITFSVKEKVRIGFKIETRLLFFLDPQMASHFFLSLNILSIVGF